MLLGVVAEVARLAERAQILWPVVARCLVQVRHCQNDTSQNSVRLSVVASVFTRAAVVPVLAAFPDALALVLGSPKNEAARPFPSLTFVVVL